MAREGCDDYRRHKQDQEENNKHTKVFRPKTHWLITKWKDIRVGDIIQLEQNDWVPADIILLHSTGEDGSAHVETAALDGETNLKSKVALQTVSEQCRSDDNLALFRAVLYSEQPNQDLYNFQGNITALSQTFSLTNHHIIYRGSVLRNVESAIGFVVFCGEESKIRMNSKKFVRTKAPSLQARVNKVVIIVVIFVIALAIFCTSAYQFWHSSTENDSWYLEGGRISFMPIAASFVILFNTLIPLSLYVSMEIIKLCQKFLLEQDIDMYHAESDTPAEARTATLNEELGQVSFIFSDKTGTLTDNIMVFRKLSIAGYAWLHELDIQREAEAGAGKLFLHHKHRKVKGKKHLLRSASLSANTALEMESYNPPTESKSVDFLRSNLQRAGSTASQWKSSADPMKVQPCYTTLDLLHYIQTHPHKLYARRARFFLLALALCHTCLPKREDNGECTYQAASPDEVALVTAAKELGYINIDRSVNTVTIKSFPNGPDKPVIEIYSILDVIEFSSARKRMSIILRFPDGRICIFCKGADSIMTARLRLTDLAREKSQTVHQQTIYRKSIAAERAMARNSVSAARPSLNIARPSVSTNPFNSARTLDTWLRQRNLEGQEHGDIYPPPSVHMSPTVTSIVNIDIEDSIVREDSLVLQRTYQHIQDFATEGLRTLLYGHRLLKEQEYNSWRRLYHEATTSLVDRQEKIEHAAEIIERDFELGGATAIEDKLQAGVPEAIDKLRRAGIKLWMLTGDKRETAINIGHSCRMIKEYSTLVILDLASVDMVGRMAQAVFDICDGRNAHTVVVIDGFTLASIEDDETLLTLFMDLAIKADSVICCRASPSQKASMVSGVRKRVKKSVILAIGDGANDIAMIQEAHVGIGITGKEGLQAARCSDYSIAQFRFLVKLLLVHGRWNYVRLSKYTLGTFYKELEFYLTQAIFQYFCGFTGTSLYEQWSLSMFNTLFTSLPVFVIGIFLKDLSATTLIAVPELYTKGNQNKAFNTRIYFGWMLVAALQAFALFFIPYKTYGSSSAHSGHIQLYTLGNLTYTCAVVIICFKLLYIEMHNLTFIVYLSSFLTVSGWFLWNIILSFTYSNNIVYNVRSNLTMGFGRHLPFWLTVFCTLAACIFFDVALITIRGILFPTDTDIFQELERDPITKARLELDAATELQASWLQESLLQLPVALKSKKLKFKGSSQDSAASGLTLTRNSPDIGSSM
ncbi:putative phospholipid-transporting ATPase [Neolecta irregularis DAH-3]|uniref:Phospholipid-transporting ATPase n=1 Tax=Neolecta irregularis (strain DAH-3) TaxID=1198029 RepID=A0A1U7LR63_NEOID|nr:putative phospholipid-transporting ATPase [Neolecta irregularis DAH-3]|eukprot:OLL25155.1 putative phospholipid-transporting ATPase [Neolecta irregularis DAH-3]